MPRKVEPDVLIGLNDELRSSATGTSGSTDFISTRFN
jgi:hypothetical protein